MALRQITRRPLATAIAALGVTLVVVALIDLAGAPERAHRAFDHLVQAQGGSMSHSPTYPDTYRTFAAQAVYLRDALIGSAGLVLTGIGTSALLREEHDRASVH
jgi:hypothetical protein